VISIGITHDLQVFNMVKNFLEKQGAQFSSDTRGLAQKYADFIHNGSRYTLSSDHYMGIQIDCYSNVDKVKISKFVKELKAQIAPQRQSRL
jgi:hypothetical protein